MIQLAGYASGRENSGVGEVINVIDSGHTPLGLCPKDFV